jgi:hypothetical protein
MSDVNQFIDAIGKDVTTAVVPRIETLANGLSDKAMADYGPRVSAFASQLVKDVINDQSTTLRDFVTTLLQDLSQRYQPELVGELHTKIVRGAVELTGHGVRLEVRRRDTGAPVSSLDIPISLKINVNELAVSLRDTTVKLDVVR